MSAPPALTGDLDKVGLRRRPTDDKVKLLGDIKDRKRKDNVRSRSSKEKINIHKRCQAWRMVMFSCLGSDTGILLALLDRLPNVLPVAESSSGRFYPSTHHYHSLPPILRSAVKLDSRDTPPPLHFSPVTSEQERSSTAETTPIGTPNTTFDTAFRRRSVDRDRDLLSSYYRKTPAFAGSTSSYVDSALLESDVEDSSFPLFQDPSTPDHNMDIHPAIAPRRHLTSNLTSALQSTSGNETRPTPAVNISNGKGPHTGFAHRDSLSSALAASGSHYGSDTHPMSMGSGNRERPRRESLAGSMVSGMSWGGLSVGSWVRDEIIMQGSSPFVQQSPSFHSSSYIPKLEANFMKDFSCCDQTMASLHDLLQHYEEVHAESLQQQNKLNQSAALPDNKAAIASNTANAVRQGTHQQTQNPTRNTSPSQLKQTSADAQIRSNPVTPKVQQAQPVTNNFTSSQHHPSLDMDTVQDMEMDDVDYDPQPNSTANDPWGMSNQSRMMQRSQFGQPASARIPRLETSALNLGNPLQQHQGLRNSNPTTPVTASRNGNPYHNNPTVSSVNTPTLTAHPMQQQCYMPTPDSSAPVSPGDMDGDFMGDLGGTTSMGARNQFDAFGNFQFGNGDGMLDLCIDEPAKRLYNANGDYNSNVPLQQTNALKLGDAQYSENSEIARTIRERQKQAGIPDGGSGPNDGIPKPYHCPVLGCEKAYKNHNGLKYHKTHGHNTQALHDNSDGTFSIVDPETSAPYPGTLGMQKHKPHQCDICGKRYKNLNGLKYHKTHTRGCQERGSPALESSKMQSKPPPVLNVPNYSQGASNAANVSGIGVNINAAPSNAGLPGIDEDMIM
ncbi:MAG: hypothetical protein Q9168_002493 [Polycauliona sp. 1 TL-2023]